MTRQEKARSRWHGAGPEVQHYARNDTEGDATPERLSQSERLRRMRECPKWSQCSAPVCPVDPDWRQCQMDSDDAVCFYAAEAVKEGAEARFQEAGLAHIYRQVLTVLPDIAATHGRIRRALERAARTGARMDRRIPGKSGDAGSD